MNLQHLPSDTTNLVASTRQTPAPARRRVLQLGLAFGTMSLGATLLSACGGSDDDPAAVSLAVAPDTGKEGETVSLTANVQSDLGAASVSFYQVTDTAETLLITLTAGPYLAQTVLPAGSAGTTLRYIARATDADGQTTTSAEATVSVTV